MENDAEVSGYARVGERLRAARVAQDLSLEAVAAQTRIPQRHLAAIEVSDYAAIPATPYAVGFVKSFARIVGLDPQEIGATLRDELAGVDRARPAAIQFAPADPTRISPKWLAITALIVAVLIVGGYGVWRGVGIGGSDPAGASRMAAGLDPIEADPGTVPGPIDKKPAPRPAAPPPVVARNVAVTAKEPVWVKLYDGATTLFMGTMTAGQRIDIPAAAANPMIWTGRPDTVTVTVGTQVIPPLGDPKRTIKDVSLKPDALLAIPAPAPAPAVAPPAA